MIKVTEKNSTTFSIEDYHAEGVRVFLKDCDLTLLYSYCVASNLSLFVGVIFRSDHIIVDSEYVERLDEVLDDLGIYPKYY